MTRLLIIGFDGMDYFLTKRTIKNYSFRSFDPILKRQIVETAVTGPSWASFYTGLKKEKHGVIDGWGRDIKNSNIFEDIEEYTFWKILQRNGYRVLTENLPITPTGFPFDSSEKRDIVNWAYHPLEDGKTTKWRDSIREWGIENVIKKAREDSFNIIRNLLLENEDIIVIQFSFIDRIGHVYSFYSEEIIKKTYNLAYNIIDDLYNKTSPEYLIVTSDHGFGENRTDHICDGDRAVLILNDSASNFFSKDKLNIFEVKLGAIKYLLQNFHLLDLLRAVTPKKYVRQTDIFDKILDMFEINNYKKIKGKIPKDKERIKIKKTVDRLKKLGYI